MTATVEKGQRGERRPDASMSLLNDIAEDALDPDYRRAAEARAAKETAASEQVGDAATRIRRPRWTGSIALGIGLLALGILVSVAYSRVQDTAAVVSVERESLIEQIRTADAEVEDLQDEVAALEADIRALETAQLENSNVGELLGEQTSALQTAVGTLPVTGPGITVSVDDAPETYPGWDPELSVVVDLDLVEIANGLWQAGAEAVAINGQRLTPMSAIRSANNIIQVNYRPLSRPYHVTAIGDDRELATRFDQSVGGQWLKALESDFGIEGSITIADDDLVLPAGNASLTYTDTEETP